MTKRRSSLIPAALGALIVMAFVFAVGRPNVFTDTRDYMINGARFYQAVRRTVLKQQYPPPPRTALQAKAYAKLLRQMHFDHSNAGARSPYYGIFLYSLAHRGTLWLLSAVQALCCAWVLRLLWRSMAPAAPEWTYYALMAALSAGTSLPWVASFAVPDVFAGVLAVAACLLAFYRGHLRRWELVGVWLLVLASAVFHSSHILLLLSLIAVGVGLGVLMKAPRTSLLRFSGLAAAAIVLAIGLSALYGAAIKWKTGDEFRRPPFLVARVLADGPGRAYLRSSCAKGVRWAICRFRNLPLDDSDHILWSAKPELGVFNRSNYETRVLMEKQEFAFVLGTIAYDPWGQFRASMTDWGLQLTRFWVDDPLRRPMVFLKHDYWGRTNLVGLLRGVGPCGRVGELCQPRVKIDELAAVDDKVVIASLALLLLALAQPRALGAVLKRRFGWKDPASRATAAALFLGAAIILNAAVCGIFSGPFARYQARVVWLLPAAALLLPLALAPQRVWAGQRLRLPQLWAEAGEIAWARAELRLQLWVAKVDPAFLRFAVVGASGFSVDAAVLYALVHGAGINPFGARLVSFSVAVMVTWLLNRTWTFKTAGEGGRLKEAAAYIGVQCAGGLANLAVYSAALITAPGLKGFLLAPLGLGSAAGLCLTFLGSKHLVFRTRRQPLAANSPAG